MSLRESFPKPRLPATHYFITIARGARTRTYAVRPFVLHLAMVLVPLFGAWSVAATVYLAFQDDLATGLIARQTEMRYSYEDRLADLRNQLDRATSRRALDQNSFEGKVHALMARQAQLEARATTIATFADQVGLGRGTAVAARSERRVRSAAPANALSAITAVTGAPTSDALPDVSGFAAIDGTPKPLPTLEPVKPLPEDGDQLGPASDASKPGTGSVPGAAARTSAIDDPNLPMAARLALMANSLDRIEARQISALDKIGRTEREETSRFNAALAEAGLSSERFISGTGKNPAVGGPFIPLRIDANGSPFDREVFDLQNELLATERLRTILPFLPFRRPLLEAAEITSGFGPRNDPFTGRPAMHTGLDFAMEYGAPVRSTAAGRVTIAGPLGGYGNMVEIDHGNGLATRYAHLSSIAVEPGQWLETGAVVGNVGSTGRATGPHLHYETRIDGEAVDPIRFLRAGQRLFGPG